MLALPHARQPAPPLAARGMWLRLRLGPDAFGSALGDSIVGSIVGGDQKKAPQQQESGYVSKPLTQADIDGFLAGIDDDRYSQGGRAFDASRKSRGLSSEEYGRQSYENAKAKVYADEDAQAAVDHQAATKLQNAKADAYGKQLAREAEAQRVTAAARASLDGFVGGVPVSADSFAGMVSPNVGAGGGAPASNYGVGLGLGTRAVQGTQQWTDLVGDSRMRLDYYKVNLEAIPETFQLGADASINDLYANAKAASTERNNVLDRTREQLSDQGREWSRNIKANGKPFEDVVDIYTNRRGLSTPNGDVYRDVIEASGRPNAALTNGAKALVVTEAGLNWVAKPLAVVGAGLDGYSLGTQINQSIDTGNWQNTGREAARITGGWTGAWAFGEAGASTGAVIGAMTGPFAPVAVPVLTLAGGVGGAILGYGWGGKAGLNYYNSANGGH